MVGCLKTTWFSILATQISKLKSRIPAWKNRHRIWTIFATGYWADTFFLSIWTLNFEICLLFGTWNLSVYGCYGFQEHKITAIRSCSKNFAVRKTAVSPSTDGWQTPDAPNNIIHARLAPGSVVEQMNAHPFAKLHTALTHNGETTNYEALKQRVERFNLSQWRRLTPRWLR